MSNLQILNNSIRTLDNLYSLNDLHLASGNDSKHRPSLFIRLETTKDLINEISKEVRSTDLIFKTLRGRNIQGTWACEELVLSYAMWISPKFHLIVLRAFLAMHKGEVKQQQLTLPKPEKKYAFELTESELQGLTWAWFAFIRGIYTFRHIYPAFEKLGSNMSGAIYGQGYEYCHTAQEAHKIISRLTKDFKCDPSNNWRVLKHVREFDTAFRKPTFNL